MFERSHLESAEATAKFAVLKSETGLPVLRFRGRLLSSAVDPVREAQSWTRGLKAPGDANTALIVLGLGGGYQVAELIKQSSFGPVLVIEQEAELIEKVREIHPCLRDTAHAMLTWDDFISDKELCRSILTKPYRVISIASSLAFHREAYLRIQKILVGRELADIAELQKLRGLQSGLAQSLALLATDTPLHITTPKEMLRMVERLPLSVREKVTLHILGEMIL